MKKLLIGLLSFMFVFGVAFAQESAPASDLSGIEAIVKMAFDFLFEKVGIAGIVLSSLAGLMVLGRIYIASTPSKSDDEWLQKIEAKPYIGMFLRVLGAFSPVQRKDK